MADKLVSGCFDVGFSNNEKNKNNPASNDLRLCMNQGWLFSDIVQCILVDPVYKLVDRDKMLDFRLGPQNQILPLHTIFLIAAFQYAVMKSCFKAFSSNGGLFREFWLPLAICFKDQQNWAVSMNSRVQAGYNTFCKGKKGTKCRRGKNES